MMKKIQMDFAPRPYTYRLKLMLIGGLLGVLLLLVLIISWRDSQQLSKEQDNLNALDAQIHASNNNHNKNLRNPQKAKEFLDLSNQVVAKLNVPWDALFEALEKTKDDSIALLTVEPEIKESDVKIKLAGEAKNLSALFAYVRSLNESGVLGKAYLIEHNVDEKNPDHPVHFSLEVSWIKR